MQSTGSEIKQLFRETQVRYPHQVLPEETLKAWLEDWREMVKSVGLRRFSEGVKRARAYSDFFPTPSKIREMIPAATNDNAALQAEMRELHRRKQAGEKFYTLADVLIEFRRMVEAGEVKGHDERGQASLEAWAKALKNSEQQFAQKMLAQSETKRDKSDFKPLAG